VFVGESVDGYPAILTRLAKLTIKEARVRLELGWTVKAPKRLLAATAPMAPAATARGRARARRARKPASGR
jgi:hypothetical protein